MVNLLSLLDAGPLLLDRRITVQHFVPFHIRHTCQKSNFQHTIPIPLRSWNCAGNCAFACEYYRFFLFCAVLLPMPEKDQIGVSLPASLSSKKKGEWGKFTSLEHGCRAQHFVFMRSALLSSRFSPKRQQRQKKSKFVQFCWNIQEERKCTGACSYGSSLIPHRTDTKDTHNFCTKMRFMRMLRFMWFSRRARISSRFFLSMCVGWLSFCRWFTRKQSVSWWANERVHWSLGSPAGVQGSRASFCMSMCVRMSECVILSRCTRKKSVYLCEHECRDAEVCVTQQVYKKIECAFMCMRAGMLRLMWFSRCAR